MQAEFKEIGDSGWLLHTTEHAYDIAAREHGYDTAREHPDDIAAREHA